MQLPGYNQQEANTHALVELVQFHGDLWELTKNAYALPMVTNPNSLEAQQIGTLVRTLVSVLMRKGITIMETTKKEGHE